MLRLVLNVRLMRSGPTSHLQFREGRPRHPDPQIVRAARPPEPIPKSGIGSGLLAHVVSSKFIDHLPLHRQEAILARHGWDVRRSTLCDHLRRYGRLLQALNNLTHWRLLRSFAIHADDTPLVLLRPRRTAYAWAYLGDAANPYTLFDLTAGRRQELPQAFLAGYTGFAYPNRSGWDSRVHQHSSWNPTTQSGVETAWAISRSRSLFLGVVGVPSGEKLTLVTTFSSDTDRSSRCFPVRTSQTFALRPPAAGRQAT
ncbi:IS66 family transposase [Urbifossiella limnaea]|uniref:Transposase IS66 family protein n=1 Tax=Urbifossiella limnaea TaxID=2528023 RepID=A0A517XNE8_9BACT|nr:transposase [Urbifossiella limnaea]QDU19031.1 Transposase IS66 family protein [Urbifossiella limnaea]